MGKRQNRLMKKIKKFKLSTFFVKKGRLQVGRVLVVVFILLLVIGKVSDLTNRNYFNSNVDVNNLPMNQLTREQFIQRVAPEAQDIQTQTGIRSSISIAQAALESDWGKSTLAYKYNNFFGVKATGSMRSVNLTTSEFEDGKWIEVKAPFRVYDSWQASMEDHADLLIHGTSDNPKRYAKVISGVNVEEAAQALVDGGYATDPGYAKKIMNLINEYQLKQYDQ